MASALYRVESSNPMAGPLLPSGGQTDFSLSDRALAVAIAAKSVTVPQGKEIRVVYVPTGEVLFRKSEASSHSGADSP